MTYSPIHDLNNIHKVEKDDLLTQIVKQGLRDLNKNKQKETK